MSTKFPLFKEFVAFAVERHAIYLRRQQGLPKPWTKDPILQSYRFCNVYRELDTVSQWIRTEWREPHWHDQDLWFAMVVARLVNWPDALAEAGYPLPWREKRWASILDKRRERGDQVFTAAYMIRGNESPSQGRSKAAYECARIFSPLWARRKEARQVFQPGTTLSDAHAFLMTNYGLGGTFLSAQVIADVKFTPLLPEADTPDWWDYAAPGPGSKKGLNLVMGREARTPWGKDFLPTLQELQARLNTAVAKKGMPRISASDAQNCCCEFLKYQRGYSRRRYPGGA